MTGTARLFAVLLHSFGLIVGVAAGLTASLAVVEMLGVVLSPPDVGRLAWASATRRWMPANAVSSPTASTRTRSDESVATDG